MTWVPTTSTSNTLLSRHCTHAYGFVPRGLCRGLDRSGHSSTCHRSCFASSTKPPGTCVDLPEPGSRVPSCEVRKQLEQLYQLEQPQSSAWYPSSLVQEAARRGVCLEQAGFVPVQFCEPPPESSQLKDPDSKKRQQEYYANLGDAIRVLRDETPYLFQQDLTCKNTNVVLQVCLLQCR